MTSWNTTGGIHEIPLAGMSGRLMLCGKHFIGPNVQVALELLRDPTVVCLVQRHELEHRYDEYIEWLENNVGSGAIWFPIPDLDAPSLKDGINLCRMIHSGVCSGGDYIVHCAAGIGRSGTIAAAVLMLNGLSFDESVIHVRTHRPMAGPETGKQTDFLRALQDKLSDLLPHHPNSSTQATHD